MTFAAIRPGTDLPSYARELVRVHDAVLAGSRPAGAPRRVVAESWERVLRVGLDPSRPNARDPLDWSSTEQRRGESPLSGIVDELARAIGAVSDASQFLLVVTDADGIVLWRHGDARVRHQADRLGFAEGAEWTEQRVGTNAIGTALAEQAPVQLFSAEHFEQGQHPWYCTAHPVHDLRTGQLLGIVDISGPALTLHPAIEALVETAVRLAEARLWMRHEARLTRLRDRAQHVLSTTAGPALVVDEDGWVADGRGLPRPARVGVPRAGTGLAVPGLGLCLPERLTDGWLLRPAGEDTRRLVARLDGGAGPVLTVTGGGQTWTTPVSARHAELLRLLHAAGPAGCTAEQLSHALFGDDAHRVTIRAEISRLRRVVGALIATRPYRIAAGVVFTCQ